MKTFRSYLSLGVIVGTLPYNIIDGSLGDAVPVMGNFNYIVAQVNANVAPNTFSATNLAMGTGALAAVTTGINDTAFGISALASVTSTSNNTGVGYNALLATTSGFNTAVGSLALAAANSGGLCTAFGYHALTANTTGFSNVAVGDGAMVLNTQGNSNTAVGSGALQSNVSSGFLTAVGFLSLNNTTGANNTAIGVSAGAANTSGTNNTFLGNNTDVNSGGLTNSAAIGNSALITASNNIVLGNGSITTLRCQTQTISALSDARHKKDVTDLQFGLEFLNKLRPVSYRFDNGDETQRFGFIAQEVEQALGIDAGSAGMSIVARDNNEEQTYLLGYAELFGPLVRAVQELTARLEAAGL